MKKKIDHINYDFEPLGLPNLLGKYKKGVDRKPVKFTPPMDEVCRGVALKHPNWTLITQNLFGYGDYLRVTSVDVYAGDEYLGEIGAGYYDGSDAVEISNPRIAQTRKRRNSMVTTNARKAIKIVSTNFGAKTVWEKLEESIDEIGEGVQRGHNLRSHDYRSSLSAIMNLFSGYIVEHWGDEYASLAKAIGVPEELITKFETRKVGTKTSAEVAECMEKDVGVVVLILGSDYCVSKTTSPSKTMRTFTTETLPAPIKAAIGLLKLVGNREFVDSVGFRLAEDKFYVMVEDERWMS